MSDWDDQAVGASPAFILVRLGGLYDDTAPLVDILWFLLGDFPEEPRETTGLPWKTESDWAGGQS